MGSSRLLYYYSSPSLVHEKTGKIRMHGLNRQERRERQENDLYITALLGVLGDLAVHILLGMLIRLVTNGNNLPIFDRHDTGRPFSSDSGAYSGKSQKTKKSCKLAVNERLNYLKNSE